MFDTDGEGGPLYGTAMSSPAPVAYNNASDCSNLVHVLVDSGASDHYFDNFLIPELNRRPLNYTCLTTPRKILIAGGCCSSSPAKEFFRASSPTTMATIILFESRSSCTHDWPQPLLDEDSDTEWNCLHFRTQEPLAAVVTLLLRGEQDDLYSFVLDLSADAYGATELAMNAVSNARLWHRRLGHLNRRNLELMQRHDGNGITFNVTIADCDVCAVEKGKQLARPKRAQHGGITRPFQLATAISWALSPPRPTGVSNTSSRSQTSSGGPPCTCWRTRAAPSTPFACSSHQLPSLAAAESFTGVPTKEGITRAKRSGSIAWKRASPRSLRPPTCLSKMACPSALAGPFTAWFTAFSWTVDFRPSCGGNSC